MKTCKDCIYYLMDKDRSYTTDAEGYCHLHPVPTATYDEHWCGQLKVKGLQKETFDEIYAEAKGLTDDEISEFKRQSAPELVFLVMDKDKPKYVCIYCERNPCMCPAEES